MSEQAIEAFRNLVNDNVRLREDFIDAYLKGPAALTAMVRKQGFDASEEEVLAAVESVRAQDELTDAELELVSAGTDPATAAANSSSSTGAPPVQGGVPMCSRGEKT
jgi:predicted ribosomally synthesized peptide with nif11-like leader